MNQTALCYLVRKKTLKDVNIIYPIESVVSHFAIVMKKMLIIIVKCWFVDFPFV